VWSEEITPDHPNRRSRENTKPSQPTARASQLRQRKKYLFIGSGVFDFAKITVLKVRSIYQKNS